MVLVYVLEDEDDQFLYRTTCGVRVDALVAELVDVWNLRQIIRRAANACAQHHSAAGAAADGGTADDTLRKLQETVAAASHAASAAQVKARTALTVGALQGHVEALRAVVEQSIGQDGASATDGEATTNDDNKGAPCTRAGLFAALRRTLQVQAVPEGGALDATTARLWLVCRAPSCVRRHTASAHPARRR